MSPDGDAWVRKTLRESRAARGLAGLATTALFLFAVRLLGTATADLSPALEPALQRVVTGEASALGVGWLAAYGLLNGSAVAAVSLSLHTAGLVGTAELFMLIVGSRLGAAAVVVLVGGLDFLQKRRYSLRRATSLGLLTFVVTHTLYLPTALVGPPLLRWFTRVAPVDGRVSGPLKAPSLLDRVTEGITAVLGDGVSFLLAVGLIVACLRLFDWLFGTLDADGLGEQYFRTLDRRSVSFGVGLVVTAVTTSVAFSLGVVVPLYNRGYVTRDEIVPYVLGASLGTLTDTLVVALVLGSTVGVATVLFVLAVCSAFTLLALVLYSDYEVGVAALHDHLLDDRRVFAAFLVALVVFPTALVVLG